MNCSTQSPAANSSLVRTPVPETGARRPAARRAGPALAALMGLGAAAAAMAGNYDAYGPYAQRAPSWGAAPYVGLSLGVLQYNEAGLSSLTPGAALLRLGVPVSPNLAFEGRAAAGLGSSSHDGFNLSLQSLYGAYIKGILPLAPQFSVYAVGGVAGVNLRRDFGDSYTNDTGLSFGLGADLEVGGGAAVNFEWTRLPTGNNLGYDYSNSMASVGMTWRF